MKTVCVLVSLLLVQLAAGRIFRPRYDVDSHLTHQPRQHKLEEQVHRSQEDTRDVQQTRVLDKQTWLSNQQANIDQADVMKFDSAWLLPLSGIQEVNTNVAQPYFIDPLTSRRYFVASEAERSSNEKEEIRKVFEDAYNTIKPMTEEKKKEYHQMYLNAASNMVEDVRMNATELIRKAGYHAEQHIVITDDGYLLTLFRIVARDIQDRRRPAVLLMHGLLGSADDWLLTGQSALAYQLVDAGMDVWIGSIRGSRYGRHHVSKHPAHPDFWQFSMDEIAEHDLPTIIDYVLKAVSQERLYYVGHSLGTSIFFALTAAHPEYNDKVIAMYALAPTVYMSNARSPLIRMIAPTSSFSDMLYEQLGYGEFMPSQELVRTVGGALIEDATGCKNVSGNIYFAMTGVDVDGVTIETMMSVMRHLPAGSSVRLMKQLGQAWTSQEFRRYDYGPKLNTAVYGSEEPPRWSLDLVRVPVHLYYGTADWLTSVIDVKRLVKELPVVKDSYQMPGEYMHTDFQFAKNAPEVVNKKVINSILQYEKESHF